MAWSVMVRSGLDKAENKHLKAQRVKSQTVSPYRLAAALDIPVDRILALADAGYLCLVGRKDRQLRLDSDRVVKFPLPERPIPIRVVDRISIILWLLGLDEGSTFPCFDKRVEMEIMRIGRLKEPMRTEQAIRMILRYRDAEELVATLAKARAGDVASVRIKTLSRGYKMKMARLAGLTDRPDLDQDQDQDRLRPHPSSSARSPQSAQSGSPQKRHPAAGQ